jgi:hypothetical protein
MTLEKELTEMKFHRFVLELMLIISILSTLNYAQKSTTPQPVSVVNNPAVTIANSPLPVSGSVSVSNTEIPVSGKVLVSNLPIDTNGNVRVSESRSTGQFEFRHAVFYLCDPNSTGWQTYLDLCPSNPDVDATAADTLLSTLSTQGWELVNISGFSWTPCRGCTSNVIVNTGVLYTFRRSMQQSAQH